MTQLPTAKPSKGLPQKPTYNHAYAIAFSLGHSTCKEGEDATPARLRAAVLKRINDLGNNRDEWIEAVGAPYDTYEEEPAHQRQPPGAHAAAEGRLWP